MKWLRALPAFLAAVIFASAAHADGTIDTLLAGSALGGTESIPMFQGANPAVKTTPAAIGTYLGSVAFPIGGTTAAAGAFTTLSASSTVSGTGFSTYLAAPPAIGGTTPAAGSFTTLSASSTVSGAGITSLFASPPAIGGTAPAAGAFTTLSATSTVSGAGITALFASPPGIGGTAPAAGAFTTLSATSTVSGAGITALFASPPGIGGTAPAAGAFTTLSASSTVSGTGFSTYLASPPSIGTTAAGIINATNFTATGTVALTGLAAGTQVSCLGLNGSNQIVLLAAACGTGGGGSLTVSDTLSHTVSATTTISLSSGLALTANGTGTATVLPYSPDRTVGTGTVTFSTSDLGGQVNIGSANATNTATIPGGSVFTVAGQSLIFSNQNATATTITNTFTAHGLGLSTKLHQFGWYAYVYNGTDLDAIGWPGYDTETNNTVPIFVDASGALTASEITDASAGGVTVGSPTGGQKGAGSLNAAALFVNGVAVSTGGTVTSIATTSPITGGTITTTGTIGCATCVTSAAALTSGKIMTGAALQASQVDANASLSAGALTLGASGTAGSVVMGNATSGTVTLQTVSGALGSVTISLPATTGNVVTTGDSATVTGAMIASSAALAGSPTTTTQSANDNSTKIATTAYVDRPTTMTVSSGTINVAGNRNYVECTTTCTVNPIAPAAGVELCVRNADNVSTVITFGALSGVQYEKTAWTSYGTVTTGTAVSAGAAGDKLCIVGKDSSHYDVMSFVGTWTMS